MQPLWTCLLLTAIILEGQTAPNKPTAHNQGEHPQKVGPKRIEEPVLNVNEPDKVPSADQPENTVSAEKPEESTPNEMSTENQPTFSESDSTNDSMANLTDQESSGLNYAPMYPKATIAPYKSPYKQKGWTDVYDKSQKGKQNYRGHVKGLTILVAPHETVIEAAMVASVLQRQEQMKISDNSEKIAEGV